MSTNYRVVDLRSDVIDPEAIIVQNARSPEDAASKALGTDVFRSGRKSDLIARVYFQTSGQPMTMVRLYSKAAGGPLPKAISGDSGRPRHGGPGSS